MTGPGGDQDAFIVECLLNGDVCLDSMIAYYCELGGIAPHLAGLLRGRAHMPQAVYNELYGLFQGRPAPTILRRPMFARVHVINSDEAAQRVMDRLRRWRGLESVLDDPLADRGEAEALEICLANGFALVSNDHNAVLDARRDGIRIGSMIDVLAVMVLRAGFNATQAWATYEGFLGRDMHPVPGYPKGAVGEAAFKELMTRCLARRAAAPTAAATSPSPKRPAKTP